MSSFMLHMYAIHCNQCSSASKVIIYRTKKTLNFLQYLKREVYCRRLQLEYQYTTYHGQFKLLMEIFLEKHIHDCNQITPFGPVFVIITNSWCLNSSSYTCLNVIPFNLSDHVLGNDFNKEIPPSFFIWRLAVFFCTIQFHQLISWACWSYLLTCVFKNNFLQPSCIHVHLSRQIHVWLQQYFC